MLAIAQAVRRKRLQQRKPRSGLARRLILMGDSSAQAEWIEFSIELILFLMLGTAAWAVFMAGRDQLMLNQVTNLAIGDQTAYGCYTNVENQGITSFLQSQGIHPSGIQVQVPASNTGPLPQTWGNPVAIAVSGTLPMPVFAFSGWTMRLGSTAEGVAQPTQSTLPWGVYCEAPSGGAA